MEIGKYLQKARKRKGLSQEEAANALYVSRQSVSLWENDQTLPTLDNLEAMSNLYEVTISVLTGQMMFPEDMPQVVREEKALEQEPIDPLLYDKKRAEVPTALGFGISMSLIVLFAIPVLGIILAIIGFIVSISARRIFKNNYNLIGIIFSSVYFIAAIIATIAGSAVGF